MLLAPDAKAVTAARVHFLRCWRERARERGYKIPNELHGACRFASVYSQELFGGRVVGNWYHLHCASTDGTIIDLTDGIDFRDGLSLDLQTRAQQVGLHVDDVYAHDPRLFAEVEFIRAMRSVETTARQWAADFLAEH
jgi:hypothetical protein